MDNKNKIRFKTEYLPGVVFILFLAVMGVMYILLPKQNYSPLEKRYLSEFPEFSFENLLEGEYTQGIEDFLADNTPFRAGFVGVNSYYNLLIGNNGANGVYLGKNGMLIEKPVDENNNLQRNIERIKSFAESESVPVNMLVVPSKGYIYNENLPFNSLKYKDKEYFAYIENTLADKVNFVNILEKFDLKAEKEKLFYNTDHHWTSAGAYLGYENICEAIGLEAKEKTDFTIESYPDFYGTSYTTSAYYLTSRESIEVWRDKNTGGGALVEIIEGSKSDKYDNMFFDDNLKADDKYTVYLDGNHSMVKIHNGAADSNKKLLLIKDSFAHCLAPFLSYNYSDIVMIDLRYYKLPVSDLIKEENCDDILFVYGIDNICTSTDIILN